MVTTDSRNASTLRAAPDPKDRVDAGSTLAIVSTAPLKSPSFVIGDRSLSPPKHTRATAVLHQEPPESGQGEALAEEPEDREFAGVLTLSMAVTTARSACQAGG